MLALTKDATTASLTILNRWLDVKYGTKEDRRQWLKLHRVTTNIVTSVEVSDGYAHDYSDCRFLQASTLPTQYQNKDVIWQVCVEAVEGST